MATQQPAGTTNPQNKDYLDKGLDKVQQSLGKKTGHNIDPNKTRGINEKITDGIRGFFEKVTGKRVPNKISN